MPLWSPQPLPYLLFSAFLLALALAALLARRTRTVLLWGGLIALPNAALEIAFIPDYWSPTLVFGGPFGLEDMVFSFSVGVLACAVALAPVKRWIESDASLGNTLGRWLRIELLFLVFFGVSLLAGFRVMWAALLGMGGVALFLGRRSRPLRSMAFFGGSGFMLLYVPALAAAFALWPEWRAAWNTAELSEVRVLGVFSEEVAWALGFGAIHAWATGYVLDLRIVRVEAVTA